MDKARERLQRITHHGYKLRDEAGISYVKLLPGHRFKSAEQHVREALRDLNVRIGTREVGGTKCHLVELRLVEEWR